MIPRIENGHRRVFRCYVVQRWDGSGGSVYHYQPKHGRGGMVVQENPYRPSVTTWTVLDGHGRQVGIYYYQSNAAAHEAAKAMAVTMNEEAA
jgi:hypothetical protein